MLGLKRNAVIGLNLYCGGAGLVAGPSGGAPTGGRLSAPGRREGGGREAAASRKALETLRRVGDGVQRNHETAFQGMLRKLDIKNEDDVKSFSRVMVHVFNDGVTNWGRIVTLISFGAFVAKHLRSINQESCIEPLAESITDILVRTKRDWLVKQRGWDGFVEFFHVEDLEGGIRNVLLAFAGVAGVGAGLAYLIR
ncbi:PREDICTED: induced myeloid leukemia cell differentiation protein Mcl-1 homolog [Elephantulus edwardii]|uniref:induced myeloid leukemia cell differentiation protein Mcl-1 homolog n=1 Tax=Elephantulus edwardii TaxID=28737 RepID=UPI0003F09EDC|nr:PREDICTED: induced myeloid leukemia cell differentiation protein Mcl-1 homolog [Elephantulus edwardii]